MDGLKELSGSRGISAILYAWIFPSIVFAGAVRLFLLPQIEAAAPFLALSTTRQVASLVGLAVVLGIFMSSISVQLSRILEGYLLWPRWLQACRQARYLRKMRELRESYAELAAKATAANWERGLAFERLRRFPEDATHIAPTRFGNALRAMETYAVNRFELDSQLLWRELLSVVPATLFEAMHDAADATNFFVAFVFLGGAFSLASLATGLWEGWPLPMYLLILAGFATSLTAYLLAVASVDNWRCETQALVNIGRIKLAAELGLVLPVKIEDERKMWTAVRSFVIAGTAIQDLDAYRGTPPPA